MGVHIERSAGGENKIQFVDLHGSEVLVCREGEVGHSETKQHILQHKTVVFYYFINIYSELCRCFLQISACKACERV